MKHILTFILFVFATLGAIHAKDPSPDRTVIYKTVNGIELKMDVFEPEGFKAADRRPAIVFFFGGGWGTGTTEQFYHQGRAFAAQGMVAFAADYRVSRLHKTTPFECVKDGKSAIRWLRGHAAELGVDPDRIVASGVSAGGHVAACTAIIQGTEEEGEKDGISSIPNAMILLCPVLDTTEKGYGAKRFKPEQQTALSPCHHVRKGIVPTLLLHGTEDETVPFENSESFTKLMKEAGNDCVLVPLEGKEHPSFIFRNGRNPDVFEVTMKHSLEFLKVRSVLK